MLMSEEHVWALTLIVKNTTVKNALNAKQITDWIFLKPARQIENNFNDFRHAFILISNFQLEKLQLSKN